MNRKLIALAAAGAAAVGMALAAPAAQADPSLTVCANIDVNGEGTDGEQCIVLPDDAGLPELPEAPELPA